MPKTSEMIESKYLKKEDVGEDGTVVTITGVSKVNMAKEGERPKFKWSMSVQEFDKPVVIGPTNIRLLEVATGEGHTDNWVGKKVVLYNDPTVSFGTDIVGGIRVRAYRKAAAPRELPPAGGVKHADKLDDDIPF